MSSHTVNLLSVSGGKDSTAMILHSIERNTRNLRYVFADTGNEHDDVYAYLDYLESTLGIAIQRVKPDFTERISKKREYIMANWANKGASKEHIEAALEMLFPTGNPFLDLCVWKGRFPSTKVRFCTEELKTIPITKQVVLPLIKEGKRIRSWQGVRADESARRATYKMHERIDFGVWVYRPLLKWTAQDVFALHRKHGINPNPLYTKGMNRVGCMPCIMCRKDELAEIAKRFPEVIERIKRWEHAASMASRVGSTTFFSVEDVGGEINYATHGIEEAVKWSMTSRGGVQYDLFKATDEIPACASNYGLCEVAEIDTANVRAVGRGTRCG